MITAINTALTILFRIIKELSFFVAVILGNYILYKQGYLILSLIIMLYLIFFYEETTTPKIIMTYKGER